MANIWVEKNNSPPPKNTLFGNRRRNQQIPTVEAQPQWCEMGIRAVSFSMGANSHQCGHHKAVVLFTERNRKTHFTPIWLSLEVPTDEHANHIPNPKHTSKYTKAKVLRTQDKHTSAEQLYRALLPLQLPYKMPCCH